MNTLAKSVSENKSNNLPHFQSKNNKNKALPTKTLNSNSVVFYPSTFIFFIRNN